MRNIDFLPQSYRQSRRRHGVRVRRLWLGGAVLGVLAIWFAVDELRVRRTRAHHDYLVSQNQTVQASLEHIVQLQAEQATLLSQYRLLQDLQPPVSSVTTVSRVTQLLPEHVTVRQLQMTCRPVADPAPRAGEAASAIKVVDVKPAVPHVTLSGIAPSQLDIAVLVGQLSGCRDFVNVRLDYSKAAELDGRRVQEFRVTFDVLGQAAATRPVQGV